MKKSTLGSYIRSLRTQNHLTQAQLAEQLHVTDKAVSKWERDLSYPDMALFPKLADILGVNVNDLLKECLDEGQPSRLMQILEMSPEVRTPLHIILGCADMAANHYEDKELVLRYLQSIRISGEYLLKTIDSISQVMNRIQGEDGSTSFEHLEKLEKHLQDLSLFHNKYLEPYDFSGKRILVAEGMEINREIAREMLRQTGAVTEFAVDGQDCLEKVMSKPADYYDLILMEFRMRKMDGIETTKRIRGLEDEKKAAIPIIAISTKVQEEDRAAAMEAGMNGFTAKPVFVDKLFAMMKQQLQEEEEELQP